jgi:hypothetical protein
MSKFNPALANIALSMLDKLNFEKEAFVPMDPASMQQQQQGGAPQGDPSQGGQPQGQPQDPSAAAAGGGQAPPQIAGAGGSAVTLDDVRSTVREEVEAANEKPKKQSVDERLTALEGAFLRVCQYLGILPQQETDLDAGLPQDADKMQEQQASGGQPGDPMAGGGAPPMDPSGGVAPPAGGDPSAGLMGPGTTGAPSSMDMPADPGQAKMAAHTPFNGLAAAVAKLRAREQA